MNTVSDLKEELTILLDGFEDTLDSDTLHQELWAQQPAAFAGGVGESYASDAGLEPLKNDQHLINFVSI